MKYLFDPGDELTTALDEHLIDRVRDTWMEFACAVKSAHKGARIVTHLNLDGRVLDVTHRDPHLQIRRITRF